MLEQPDFKYLKSYLEEQISEGAFPGCAVSFVTKTDSKKMYVGNSATVPEITKLKEGSIYDLASLTKVISTTTIALQCMEKGMLSLQTSVQSILNWFPYDSVKILHLMTHTSGVCSDDKNYKQCRSKEELIRFLIQKPLDFVPGTRVEYSDFGYILLGLVLEKLIGPLDVYAEKNIFVPLKMFDTFFCPADKNCEDRCVPTEITQERGLICGEVHDGKAWRMGGVSGNAGLFSTVEDLGRFVRMILNNGELDGQRVLSTASVNLFHKCYTEGLNLRRTLGWFVDEPTAQMGDYYSSQCLFHTGFTGTSVYIDFERGCGIVFLTNRIHPSRDNEAVFEVRRALHNILLADWDDKKGGA